MRKIEPRPSRLLGLLLFTMTAFSLLGVYLAAIPAAIQFLLGLAVIGLGIWGGRRARMTEALRMTGDGQLQSRDGQGEWRDIEVLGDSLASPVLIVLRYRFEKQRVRTQILLPDSANAEELRRLRVSLRWARHTRSDTASPGAG